MFSNRAKLSLFAIVSAGLLFTACGESSDEAKSYDIQMWLDSGDNQQVLNALGDCGSYIGLAKEECYLNVGAAYFAIANFDMLSLAQEFSNIDDTLSDNNKSKEFNKIVFKKLDDDNLKKGLEFYTKIVDDNSSVCNEKDYDSLSKNKKQACLSINPLLLSNIIDDNNDSNKSEIGVSIEQIIEFKDVLQDAVPELKGEDLISIIDGDDLSSEDDANNNGTLDSVEATSIVLGKINYGVNSNYIKNTQTNVYTNTKLSGVDYYNLQFANSNSKNYYRLTQVISGTSPILYTTLTTIPNTVCDINNTKTTGTIDGITHLPCVKLKDDGNVTSFNDSVVNILNNDNLINSIALASESEDDTKTDEEKISNFKTDICNITGTASLSNNGLCEVDSSGNITITQEALINYMNEIK